MCLMSIVFNEYAASHNFKLHKPMGVEFDDKVIHAELVKRNDRTSIMLRHRPDILAFMKHDAILLQVKGRRRNIVDRFFVEVDSWRGAMEWNRSYRHVAFVFIDVTARKIYFSWADQLIFDVINVPKRFDHAMQYERMVTLFPDKTVKLIPHSSGSGTPYFQVGINELKQRIDVDERVVSLPEKKSKQPPEYHMHISKSKRQNVSRKKRVTHGASDGVQLEFSF